MKKQLSPEQIKARDERRAALRALMQRISKMSDIEKAQLTNQVGAVMTCEGHPLSLTNTMLLLLQTGGKVSVVGGFMQWQKVGRCVRKGEHGLGIWIPLGAPKQDAPPDQQTDAASVHFMFGTVFDISQTEEIQKTQAA